MVPDTTMFDSDKAITGQSGANHTAMAIPTLVSSPAGNAGRLPSSTFHEARHNSEPHQPEIHNEAGSSDTGRMAHIQKSLASRGVSTQATNLLLSSWRDKTNSNYNSLFAKWTCWCEQRERDPTSGPVEDVMNLLAELFDKGYQYRSLNSYRLAISSIHEKIDGQNVGQHPLVSRPLKSIQ